MYFVPSLSFNVEKSGLEKTAEVMFYEPIEKIKSKNCRQSILDSKGIHIDPYGNVFSGSRSRITLGNITQNPLDKTWQQFHPTNSKFIDTLFNLGPAGLLEEALALGYEKLNLCSGKCHLCFSLRKFFFERGFYKSCINPAECYSEVS